MMSARQLKPQRVSLHELEHDMQPFRRFQSERLVVNADEQQQEDHQPQHHVSDHGGRRQHMSSAERVASALDFAAIAEESYNQSLASLGYSYQSNTGGDRRRTQVHGHQEEVEGDEDARNVMSDSAKLRACEYGDADPYQPPPPQSKVTALKQDSSSSSDDSLDSNGSEAESLRNWKLADGSDHKHGHNKGNDDDDEQLQRAQREERIMVTWFFLLLCTLLLGGIAVAVATYVYLSNQERAAMEAAFYQNAQAAAQAAALHIQSIQHALVSQSQSLTALAVFASMTWPFVTVPEFDTLGNNFNSAETTEFVAWGPVLGQARQQVAWQPYTNYLLANSGWFPPVSNDTKASVLEGTPRIVVSATTNHSKESPQSTPEGLYVPLWQTAPYNYNTSQWEKYNLTAAFSTPIELLLRTKLPMWSSFQNANDPFPIMAPSTSYEATHTTTATTVTAPLSTHLFQPIFKELPAQQQHAAAVNGGEDHVDMYDHNELLPSTTLQSKSATQVDQDPTKDVVGVYVTSIRWDRFFEPLLPALDMQVVLSNHGCGESVTFRISSSSSSSLAGVSPTIMIQEVQPGDAHLAEFDDLFVTANFAPFPMPGEILEYANDPTAKDLPVMCTYSMTLYPTTEFQEAYITQEPVYISIILAVLCFIVMVMFCLCSWSVKHRQAILLDSATKTSAIVSSLFPANVRDRLMNEGGDSHRAQQLRKGSGNHVGSASTHRGRLSILGGMTTAATRRLSMGSGVSSEDRDSVKDPPSGVFRKRGAMNDESDKSADNINPYGSKPIAHHYPDVTVLFADLVGFTAWSSMREPTQVFELLESLYHSFDMSARRRGIFKVETIGDCYVAVCGLPQARADHAVAMCYFANDCSRKMRRLVKKLDVTLGPGTSELRMRVGLHSGSVTAGVLRGEKSRFQLFGDTVNTAARMESNGMQDRIHISESTAQHLRDGGKEKWITAREDKIIAKGKGEMQTYWVMIGTRHHATASQMSADDLGSTNDLDESYLTFTSGDGSFANNSTDRSSEPFRLRKVSSVSSADMRLVDWNVENLLKKLKRVVSDRKRRLRGQHSTASYQLEEMAPGLNAADCDLRPQSKIIDEVTEVIKFPDAICEDAMIDNGYLAAEEIGEEVKQQLHDYMARIASLYSDNPNPFHSFAHASHVAMAIMSWLSRVTPPPDDPLATAHARDDLGDSFSGDWVKPTASRNVHTLIADPLTQFALVFAALIHDVGHVGVPNVQLGHENDKLACSYDNRSIHEQNALHVSFNLLMEDNYDALRCAIYSDETEFRRFRHVVINAVMSTDILDDGVTGQQSVRWGCIFKCQEEINKSQEELMQQSHSRSFDNGGDGLVGDDASETDASSLENIPENEEDIKASIVLEHMMVVADITHTMQHWFLYRKWNALLFEELYMAYKAGRGDTDPSTTWYEDELEFFDEFVIPMASKMKDCNLFDTSNDDFLAHAESNREQWKTEGLREVAKMLENVGDEDEAEPVPNHTIRTRNIGR